METIARISSMLDASTLLWYVREAGLDADDIASSRFDHGSCTISCWYSSKLVCSIDTTRSANESNQETT